jgi:hypothetical protein
MDHDNVVSLRRPNDRAEDPLTEVLRQGARTLLAQAIEAEVATLLASHAGLVDEAGRRRLVRNGFLPERTIQTGIGGVAVRQPRVRDRALGPSHAKVRFTEDVIAAWHDGDYDGLHRALGVKLWERRRLRSPSAPSGSDHRVMPPRSGSRLESSVEQAQELQRELLKVADQIKAFEATGFGR